MLLSASTGTGAPSASGRGVVSARHSSKQGTLGGSIGSGVPQRRLHKSWRTHTGSASHAANSSQQHSVHWLRPKTGPQVCPSAPTTDVRHAALHEEATQ